MQYPLNYSGTRFLSTENKNTQSSNAFRLKLYGHAPGYLIDLIAIKLKNSRAIISVQLVVLS